MKTNAASNYLKKKRNNQAKRKPETEDLLRQIQEMDTQNGTQTFNWRQHTGIGCRDFIANKVKVILSDNAGPREQAQENLKIRFRALSPSVHFTGRQSLLITLTEKLNQCLDKIEWQDKTVVISGLGGVGKTELVRKYVRDAVRSNVIQHVAVIDAASHKTAKESFRDLARYIPNDLDGYQLDTSIEIKNAVDKVFDHFANQINNVTLFIFENVTEMSPALGEKVGIFNFLPTKLFGNDQKCPMSLIISRKNNWTGFQNHLRVDAWATNEAKVYLASRFNETREEDNIPIPEIQRESIGILVTELRRFPLGLTIATSNILDDIGPTIMTKIKNYIDDRTYDNEKWRLQKLSETSLNNYPFTMDDVFEADIDRIHSNDSDGKKALQLLHLISRLCSDPAKNNSEITHERMEGLCLQNGLDPNVRKHKEALQALYKYSMFVTTQQDLLPFQIHEIIQLCKSKWVGEYLRSKFS